MIDIVERLRQHALPDPHDEREVLHAPLLSEAADVIESLSRLLVDEQAHSKQLETGFDKALRRLAKCQAHEDHYRAALEMFIMPMPDKDKDTTVMDVLLAATEAAMEALALPSDSTELDTMLKAARLRGMHEAGG